MRHERVMAAKWRLKKTLARKPVFRPIEQEDMKYIWAAYRNGALETMGDDFKSADLSAADFAQRFEQEILANYSGAWTMFAETKRGMIPVGLALGFYSHHDQKFAPFMIVGDLIWFPWSTHRNRIESAVNFFHRIRSTTPMVEYARGEYKRFFEMICQHGVMRRIGTTYNVYPNEATAIYETRAP